MALFETINSKISKGLKDNKYKYLWLSLFMFVILILSLQMVSNTAVSLISDYAFYYALIAYFSIVTGVIYFNLKVLVPHFLLVGKMFKYALSIVGSVSVTFFLIIIAQNLFFNIDEAVPVELPLVNLLGNMVSIGMIIVSTSVYALFKGWAQYSQQVNDLQVSTKEAELQQLKSQVNPHFLFNTINNANIKVEKDPQLAFNMITKLEDLLRYQLKDTVQEKVY